MKKKFLLAFAGIFLMTIFAFTFASCDNGTNDASTADTPAVNPSPDTPDTPEVTDEDTLSYRLLSAKEGDVIDIEEEELKIDKTEYTITKSVTIQNGNLEGVVFNVEDATSRGVKTFVELIFSKIVGCSLNVKVESSVSMRDSVVVSVFVEAPSVKVMLGGETSVKNVVVQENSCSINSESEKAIIETVNVISKVMDLKLSGKTSIENLCTESDKTKVQAQENSEIKIENSTVDVENTDVKKNIEPFTEATVFVWKNGEPEGTVLSAKDGVYTLSKEIADDYWTYWIMAQIDYKGAPGKSYSILYDIMSDVDTTVQTKVKTQICEGNERCAKVSGGSWQTLRASTGIYKEGFERLFLELPVDSKKSAVTYSVKNIRIQEEAEASELKYNTWSNNDLSDIEVSEITVNGEMAGSVTFKGTYKENEYWSQGVCFSYVTPESGYGLYKITYKVNAKNTTKGFRTAPRFAGNDSKGNCGWAWCEIGYLPAGEDVEIQAYLPYEKGHIFRSYEKDSTSKENLVDSDKNPYLCVSASDTIPNTIVLKDLKLELVTGGYKEILTDENYEEGKAHLMWVNQLYKEDGMDDYEEAYFIEELDYENGSVIGIPANASVATRLALLPMGRSYDPWYSGYVGRNSSTHKAFCGQLVHLWDGIEPSGISAGAVISSNNEGLFTFTNTTSQDKYLLIKLNDNCEFTLTETTNSGYVMNSQGLSELGFWLRDWYSGENKKFEVEGDSFKYKFTYDGEDGGYYPFKLYSYLNVFGAVDITNPIGREKNIYYSGPMGTLNAGPLYSGKSYTLVINEYDSYVTIGIDGDVGEEEEVINENPNWFYYDIDTSEFYLIGFHITAISNYYNEGYQTLDLNLFSEEDRNKGVAYYAFGKEMLPYPVFCTKCTVSTVSDKPYYNSIDGKIRIYVSAPQYISEMRIWAWGSNPVTSEGINIAKRWEDRPYMTPIYAPIIEKPISGTYKGDVYYRSKDAIGDNVVLWDGVLTIVEDYNYWKLEYGGIIEVSGSIEKDGEKYLLLEDGNVYGTLSSWNGWNTLEIFWNWNVEGAVYNSMERISE